MAVQNGSTTRQNTEDGSKRWQHKIAAKDGAQNGDTR